MKLLDSLFSISQRRCEASGDIVYDVSLDPEHFIYKAHFPGEPITPGVCIMQMVIELLEDASGERLELDTAKNVKFLQVIQPQQTPRLNCTITRILKENDTVSARARLSDGDAVFAGLSLICRIRQ